MCQPPIRRCKLTLFREGVAYRRRAAPRKIEIAQSCCGAQWPAYIKRRCSVNEFSRTLNSFSSSSLRLRILLISVSACLRSSPDVLFRNWWQLAWKYSNATDKTSRRLAKLSTKLRGAGVKVSCRIDFACLKLYQPKNLARLRDPNAWAAGFTGKGSRRANLSTRTCRTDRPRFPWAPSFSTVGGIPDNFCTTWEYLCTSALLLV